MSFGRIAVLAFVLVLALACSAAAQHANFKLLDLGKDEPEAAATPEAKPGDPEAKPGAKPAAKKDPWDVPKEEIFVHPISAPYFHEDSFVTSDVRAWYLYHKFSNYGLGGGHVQIVAVQVRVAINDEFQFVAYKDGYTWYDESADILKDGWNDVAFGFKWNFLHDWEEQMHAAVGIGYEIACGRSGSQHDDEEWRVWGSFNKGFGALHLGGTVNFFYAPDKAANANSMDLGSNNYITWHAHADYRACDVFSPVVEMNGYHVVSEGAHNLVDFQGCDAINIAGGKKNYVITTTLGGAIRPGPDWLEIRGGYEFPISNKDDIWRWRATLSAVISF